MDIAKEDLERCKKVVGNLFLKRKGIELTDAQLTSITKDIMIISDSHGGSFASDIILGFAKGYIDSNLYEKYIDTNQSKFEDLIADAKSDIQIYLDNPNTMPSYMTQSQLEMIMKELENMAYYKGEGSFNPYYPRGISDSWDYNDALAKKLMSIAAIYVKLKTKVRQ